MDRVLSDRLDRIEALLALARARAAGAFANGGEQDHLIDHVTIAPAVLAAGSGTSVQLTGQNAVGLAGSIIPVVSGMLSYGVFEGVDLIIRTWGIVPDLRLDPTLAFAPLNPTTLLYVSSVTPGTLTTTPGPGFSPAGWVVDGSGYSAGNRRAKVFVMASFKEAGPPP
jgi:hypothetical protein